MTREEVIKIIEEVFPGLHVRQHEEANIKKREMVKKLLKEREEKGKE